MSLKEKIELLAILGGLIMLISASIESRVIRETFLGVGSMFVGFSVASYLNYIKELQCK